MPDNALALIAAKIAEIEEKLNKLRVAEAELSKLTGEAPRRGRPPGGSNRPKKPDAPENASERRQSLTTRIREFLRGNGPAAAQAIADSLGVETRPVSFALQALKRRDEVKSKGGEWLAKGRRKAA